MTRADATTLRCNHSTSHVKNASAKRAAPGRAGKIRLGAQKRPLRPKFRDFGAMRNIDFCVQNVRCWASWNRTLFPKRSGVTNSFCDLTPPIESPSPKNLGKIQDVQNEFTDFQKFKVEHPQRRKTIFDSSWLEKPVFGITLQLTALRVT